MPYPEVLLAKTIIIRSLRDVVALTPMAFAHQLTTNQPTIRHWEAGEDLPNSTRLAAIVQTLAFTGPSIPTLLAALSSQLAAAAANLQNSIEWTSAPPSQNPPKP